MATGIDQVVNRAAIAKLGRLCRRWGGELILLATRDQFDATFWGGYCKRPRFDEAPAASWHGVCYRRKQVYAVDERADAGALIHEMGHVFADRYSPGSGRCHEFRWLGWEIALARKVGCYDIWDAQNAAYGLGDDSIDGVEVSEWGCLNARETAIVIENRLAFGRKIGILDGRNQPLAIR